MVLKASEISELIKQRIEGFEDKAEARDVGTVITLTDGIARIHGLAAVQYGEMIEFPGGSYGLALNLEQDSVGCVLLGEYKHISEGDTAKTTGRILEVPVGDALLGRGYVFRIRACTGAGGPAPPPVFALRALPSKRRLPEHCRGERFHVGEVCRGSGAPRL